MSAAKIAALAVGCPAMLPVAVAVDAGLRRRSLAASAVVVHEAARSLTVRRPS